MIVLRIVLTIICMAMIGYLIYDEKKMRQMRQLTVGEALKTLAWYCMKHDCDDCKLHIDNECFFQ